MLGAGASGNILFKGNSNRACSPLTHSPLGKWCCVLSSERKYTRKVCIICIVRIREAILHSSFSYCVDTCTVVCLFVSYTEKIGICVDQEGVRSVLG